MLYSLCPHTDSFFPQNGFELITHETYTLNPFLQRNLNTALCFSLNDHRPTQLDDHRNKSDILYWIFVRSTVD